MRRFMLLFIVGAVMTVTLAVGAASAHEHQICTPGQGAPTLAEEPFHGEDPTGGAILNNPNVTQQNYDAWGLHPKHHFLHVGPSSGDRAVTVVRTDTATCP